MKRYFSKQAKQTPEIAQTEPSSERTHNEVDIVDLPADPRLRKQICEHALNIQDQVRRLYLQRGPFQPVNHNFPQTIHGEAARRFNPLWFNKHADWLEYSIAKDRAFCIYCFLFREGRADCFAVGGFNNWKKPERIADHVGKHNSAHNEARRKCENLMNQRQHILSLMNRQSDQERSSYRVRLNASVDCIRFLQRQGLAFRGHDESEDSTNQGNFLELLRFLTNHNEDIDRVVLQNAPENNKLIAPDIQKDIANAAAIETTNAIIKDLGDGLFSLLVDECRDVSTKVQVAFVLRYVDKRGCVIERFLGLVHALDTSAATLKEAVELILSNNGLSLSRLWGQGYDGASNMRGELNGLKTLIMEENGCAYYVHCFAHQLQLALVAVAKNYVEIGTFFLAVASAFNVAGASCKRRDALREKQAAEVIEALKNGELPTGRGLNQEISLKRAGDTRWGSHYGALSNMILMFSSVVDVVKNVVEDGSTSTQRAEANMLLNSMLQFDFAFNLHLMKTILGILNELSHALQRKEQDIVNAMNLVNISKQRLQEMRDNGWQSLLEEVSAFCIKNHIDIPNMDDSFQAPGRQKRGIHKVSNLHRYRVELLYKVIDTQVQELNNRFTEKNTELLICMSCLNPNDSFAAFNKQKLVRLANFYPHEFSDTQLMTLDNQLETYIFDMRSDNEFSCLKGIGQLAKRMVEMKKNMVYPLVYSLVTLALILPVATTIVERAFSAMKIVKNRLRNRMGDQWMNDNLVTYIEKDVFKNIDNVAIMERFQNMKTRRGQL